MGPRRGVRRLLMALEFQAFMDESQSSDEFVLGGYIQTAEVWARFALDWEKLLPYGTIAKNGKRHFHMTEMAYFRKMADVPKFYSVIEKHNLVPVILRMNMEAFKNAQESMRLLAKDLNLTIDWGLWSNPYYFSFRQFLHNFHIHRHVFEDAVPLTEKVDFYFDNRSESAPIMAAWSEIRQRFPDEVEKYFGANPRFEDDQEFLALQAADLWSWWVRHWYDEEATEGPDRPEKMRNFDFDGWRGQKREVIVFSADEPRLFEILKAMAMENLTLGHVDPMTRAAFFDDSLEEQSSESEPQSPPYSHSRHASARPQQTARTALYRFLSAFSSALRRLLP